MDVLILFPSIKFGLHIKSTANNNKKLKDLDISKCSTQKQFNIMLEHFLIEVNNNNNKNNYKIALLEVCQTVARE